MGSSYHYHISGLPGEQDSNRKAKWGILDKIPRSTFAGMWARRKDPRFMIYARNTANDSSRLCSCRAPILLLPSTFLCNLVYPCSEFSTRLAYIIHSNFFWLIENVVLLLVSYIICIIKKKKQNYGTNTCWRPVMRLTPARMAETRTASTVRWSNLLHMMSLMTETAIGTSSDDNLKRLDTQ